MAERCTVQKADGSQCRAYRMKGADRCFLHRTEPEIKQRALIAQKCGGLANVIRVGELVEPMQWPKQVHLRKPRDVRRFVSRTLNELRTGRVEPQLANSIFVGCQVILKSLDEEAIERLEALERAVRERGIEI